MVSEAIHQFVVSYANVLKVCVYSMAEFTNPSSQSLDNMTKEQIEIMKVRYSQLP